MMPSSLSDRLQRLNRLKRLGVQKGTAHIVVPPPKPPPTDPLPNQDTVPLHFLNYQNDLQHAAPIQQVIPGQVITNAHGAYFSFEARYPLNAPYGALPLAQLLSIPMTIVAAITGDESWHSLAWHEVLFIDTETTGLDLAAGTVAFLIGMGYLQGDDFVVRQVFMRDFDEETALLYDLQTLFNRFKAIASFNGKTFDLPLLENRLVLARLSTPLLDAPHFDLLHPARRLWQRRLENCKLATLEREILGVIRSQADIPGYFIPTLYRKYLVDHDARPMAGIFYHNEMDIVSMASLAAAIGQYAAYPTVLTPNFTPNPTDLVSIGLWQAQAGNTAAAEIILNHALNHTLPPNLHHPALTALAYLLKKQDRLPEAETCWQQLAATPNNLTALEELAKYYEWHIKDFARALTCIAYALKTIHNQPESPQKQDFLAAWQHRRNRVMQKQNNLI